MAGKLTSQTIYWLCTLAIFISSYTLMDLATKHLMYVKIEHEPYHTCESRLSNFTCASGRTLTAIIDISPSNGSGDAEVEFELSSFTEETVDEHFDEYEQLTTADSATGVEGNDIVSVLDMKNGIDGSSGESLDQNTRYYDPQVYVDHYRNVTINDGSMKIADSPPVIFIMTQWRFGSSVLGELLNQNSDLFYLFEPLWPTHLLRKMKGIRLFSPESQQISRDILRKLTRCQFDADFVKTLDYWGGKINNKAICRASQGCKLISPSWMSSFCRKYKGRLAAKLIRANLELLKPLVVDDKINLKIIHLVRDPRGSAFSRINYKLKQSGGITMEKRSQFPKLGRLKPLNLFSVTPETSDTVRGMCQWIRENAIVSPDLLPAWLQGRYYLVRYEDFADTPLKVTRDLYRFAGIPFRREVQDWVIQNTHVPVSDAAVFSTHKNSQVASTHWIKDLTKMEVGQIEEECMDVLELMGYEPYNKLINKERSSRMSYRFTELLVNKN